jgi:hypothetical protein
LFPGRWQDVSHGPIGSHVLLISNTGLPFGP